jgi:predicted amidophosphoribosyltransferase
MAGLPGRLLFPPVCPACRRLVARPFTLCGACWPKLRFIERPWCEVLGTPFSHEIGEGIVSADAIASPPPFARARSAVAYDGVARLMVMNLKFGDRTELAPTMARWMMRPAAELLAQADAVAPVPLHRGRFLRRRFNQSAELARALCALAGLSCPTRWRASAPRASRSGSARASARTMCAAHSACRRRRRSPCAAAASSSSTMSIPPG